MKTDLIVPVVHLNGTGKQDLIDMRERVDETLRLALAALKQMAPNGRDYYPVPGLMDRAVEQHFRRMRVLTDLQDELEEEIRQIDQA